MLTTFTLLFTLAATPSQLEAAALSIEMDAALLAATPVGQQLVASAMWCEATQRKVAAQDALSRSASAPLVRFAVRASVDVDTAKARLDALGTGEPDCGQAQVAALAECLGATPPAKCDTDHVLLVGVRAAEILQPQTDEPAERWGEGLLDNAAVLGLTAGSTGE